jgi:VanZ family protein
MRELKRKKLWWGVAWGLLALVFILSLVPMPPPPIDVPRGFDKYEHILAYATLSAYFGQLCCRLKSHLRCAFGLFCMGALLEVLQGLTWYRSPDVYDLAANTIGVIAGLLISLTPLRTMVTRLDARL